MCHRFLFLQTRGQQIPLIKKNHPTMYKNNQPIVIDIRFKDQIVFTKENKGIV